MCTWVTEDQCCHGMQGGWDTSVCPCCTVPLWVAPVHTGGKEFLKSRLFLRGISPPSVCHSAGGGHRAPWCSPFLHGHVMQVGSRSALSAAVAQCSYRRGLGILHLLKSSEERAHHCKPITTGCWLITTYLALRPYSAGYHIKSQLRRSWNITVLCITV